MTRAIVLPRIGTATAWRDAARGLLAEGVPPEEVCWGDDTATAGLFDTHTAPSSKRQVSVPRSFISMAETVVWHSDPQRFARLYEFLWRLQSAPWLMTDRGDAGLAKLRALEKNVRRCQHKMKAFVRFREIGDPKAPRRSFAAWFEPTHHTVEPTAQFFRRRFGDMDWRILTPDVSAYCTDGVLSFDLDQPKPDLPSDAHEDLWVTYFRNIFNPARLKVQAMQSEMPKKYWKNMPEAAAIAELIATAPARARAMAEAAPTLPPARAAQAQAMQSRNVSAWAHPAEDLPAAIRACTRCPLHECATQAVPGEGPPDADLMIVGEQPGDLEDLQGRPFVGPAGQLFDASAQAVGLDRSQLYLTNAVKHFKFTPRGKRRIHQRPNTSEIDHCKWWLHAELREVSPKLVVAMGATAALALTGDGKALSTRRGTVENGSDGVPVLITYHPSYILRLTDAVRREQVLQQFRADLSLAADIVSIEATTP
ncbi:UdgX family uracil-DNA binding protein [Litoreibacter arenae]|uniref:Type-4 uracil-DNA glycosylase n=1 Tax=Litoreibacter arenae DSM 19593 TaxID=1123360 RepID=S9QH05_9RHOB|nr:UdgX family uracil-DNA binding protein [Litoreibacter arenae]EPX78893.1 Domain often clustered or fused with uracil-DNA glycosylase / Uracil-DNA glycosylase [Litoreibacter arenae DSM 19593]